MKSTFLIFKYLLCASLLFFVSTIYAQKKKKEDKPKLSKQEIKALQNELKDLQYNLQSFKAIKDENANLDRQVSSRQTELSQKKTDSQTASTEMEKKDQAIEYMQEQLRKLRINEVNASKQGRGSRDCEFSVQIGAYKSKNLTQYMDNHPYFTVEQGESGFKKYMLGYFTYYWEAKAFSKYLNETGAQSYVVGFYKTKRIPDLKDMTQCTF